MLHFRLILIIISCSRKKPESLKMLAIGQKLLGNFWLHESRELVVQQKRQLLQSPIETNRQLRLHNCSYLGLLLKHHPSRHLNSLLAAAQHNPAPNFSGFGQKYWVKPPEVQYFSCTKKISWTDSYSFGLLWTSVSALPRKGQRQTTYTERGHTKTSSVMWHKHGHPPLGGLGSKTLGDWKLKSWYGGSPHQVN